MTRYLSWQYRSLAIALASLLTPLGFGCTSPSSDNNPQASATPASSTENQTATVHVAVVPWQSREEQQKKLQPLADYLHKSTGRKFDFQITKDYKTSVDLLVNGKVDIAYLGGSTYVLARQQNPNVEPIVAPIDQTTGRPWYSAVIAVNTGSGIKSLADLKGKRFAFVSPNSTSGYLVPMVKFKATGINPERDFASVKYSGSHDKVQADLAAGVVDAIADEKPSFLRSQKSGKLNTTKYKIIWESDPIPTGPIVVSTKLPPQLIADLKRVLINSPAGLVDVSGTQSAGYTLTKDSDYEPIRQLKTSLESNTGAAK
ncbi:phosphate/phosphite/phosphonate ABC transporter substrate-binding protein [Chlorogloeopsis fritschii PCC 9212]|uniref:substrate-binding domain-containing protein n=1 Tax=Chlorogloeopsis fritschii TaxID=1124 RepID=UPI0002E37AB7|nr:phosphate/phosphite/phosphonate ABC transporter substrate-binding protein [Chlorogloeopsis fritschii]